MAHVLLHIRCAAMKTACMLQDKATLLLLPYVFFWGHLVLNCCTGSWGSTDSLLNCQEECELYPSFALVCILVACMSRFSAPVPACVCVWSSHCSDSSGGARLTHRLVGSLGTQTATGFRPITGLLSLGQVRRKSDTTRAG